MIRHYSTPAICPRCAHRFEALAHVETPPEVVALQGLLSGATIATHVGLIRIHAGRLQRCLIDVGITNDPHNPETTTPVWVDSHLPVTDFLVAARRLA